MNDEALKSLNYLKVLSVDMISKARSGNPGITLGAASIVFTLFTNHLKINPDNPNWINRDRFIMSAGHGSALLYAALYMAGYKISVDDLMNYRRIDSILPGLPEYKVTPGVDFTTGLFGQGLASAVGMCIAERYIASIVGEGLKNQQIMNHYVYVLCSDGDLMEGVNYEATSFAGIQGLGKLIVLYDSNGTTLDSSTKDVFKESILNRFDSIGWDVQTVPDEVKEIDKAISRAKKNLNKPSIIEVKTTIGKGTYNAGKSIVHGKPLSNDDLATLRKNLGVTTSPFEVDEKAINYFKDSIHSRVDKYYKNWAEYYQKYHAIVETDIQKNVAFLENGDIIANFDSKNFQIQSNYYEELRESNSKIMNLISDRTKYFLGGSSDLSSSCRTNLFKELEMSKERVDGKNIKFGLRENAMGAILNGMSSYGLNVYGSTHLAFADYLKPAIRTAAMMDLPTTFIFTHDSITVGGEGMAHEPIEQLTMLRCIPNLTVYRPADIREVIASWDLIIKRKKPSALVITEQPAKIISSSNSENAKKGAYIIMPEVGTLTGILIATGLQVSLACEVKEKNHLNGLRVVSMPSLEIFKEQDIEYQNSIIPKNITTITLEYGNTMIWNLFASSSDHTIGVNSFGVCGTPEEVKEKLELNYDKVSEKILKLLGVEKDEVL